MTADEPNIGKLREQAIDWLLKLHDAPDDMKLNADFEAWVASNPRHAEVYELVRCLMGDASRLLSSDPAFVHTASTRKSGSSTGRSVALSLCLAMMTGAFFALDMPLRLKADAISGTAERQTLNLPDGSELILNADTAVSFKFSSSERRVVVLKGEVFATVAADKMRPFVVEANGGTTTALGTAFDVEMSKNGTNVTVLEHSVQVEAGDANRSIRIKENQKVAYDAGGSIGSIETVDPLSIAAWRQGRLVFENRPLSSVVAELERYLPGRIVIAGAKIGERRITGSFDLADPQAVLRDLTVAFDVGVTRLGPYLTMLH
jgi:transmembrane sensor